MRIGIRLPKDFGPGASVLRDVAHAADDLGFDSVWSDAHTAIPASVTTTYPLAELGRANFGPRTPFPDPFIALGVVAGLTRRVRLGTAVVPLTSTHPLLLAKQAATLDLVSDGRLELGLGAGWLLEEAVALGQGQDHPSGRLREAIQIMRAAWHTGMVEWHGRYYTIPPVGLYPTPPQGDALPLWIGGHGGAAERIAAQTGAGLLLSRFSPAQIAARRAQAPSIPLGVTLTLDRASATWLPLAEAYRAAGLALLVLIVPEGPGVRLMDSFELLSRTLLPPAE